MFIEEQSGLLWDDFRIVLAVARCGSLKRAAEFLNSSHPTVFRRIRDIEKTLGVSLFSRNRQGYRPTESASALIALAERIEADIRQMQIATGPNRDALAGQVSLTVAPVFIHSLLPPILKSLRERLPQIQLELGSSDRLLDLSQHEADIALRSGGQPPEHLVGKRICRMAVCAYYPKDWGPVATKGWEALPWVTPDASYSHQASVAWLKREGHFERAVVRCDSIVDVARLADAGVGMALLPCYIGDVMPGLRRAAEPVEAFASDLWVLWHPQWRGVKRIGAVVEHLVDELQARRRLIEGDQPAALFAV